MDRRTRGGATLLLATAFVLGTSVLLAGAASAQKAGAKSTQTEAVWVGFDAAAKKATVKIKKPGKGPNKDMLKANQEAVFNVEPEGSVLTRTSVAVNGVKGELKDIPAGKQVNVYWVPDEKKKGEFFARKIDVVLSEEELQERYGTEE
jgi:hypothetical protein